MHVSPSLMSMAGRTSLGLKPAFAIILYYSTHSCMHNYSVTVYHGSCAPNLAPARASSIIDREVWLATQAVPSIKQYGQTAANKGIIFWTSIVSEIILH